MKEFIIKIVVVIIAFVATGKYIAPLLKQLGEWNWVGSIILFLLYVAYIFYLLDGYPIFKK